MTVLANMAMNTKDLADDIKETIARQTNIVTDLTKKVRSAIQNIEWHFGQNLTRTVQNLTRIVQNLMGSFRSFFKSILQPLCKSDIIPNIIPDIIPSTISSTIPSTVSSTIENTIENTIPNAISNIIPNTNFFNISHLPLIGKGFEDLQDKTNGNNVFALLTGENTSVATSNNDSSATETDVNESTKPAAVMKENTLMLNNDPDRTEAKLNENNKVIDSASLEGAAQSKEIKEEHMTS